MSRYRDTENDQWWLQFHIYHLVFLPQYKISSNLTLAKKFKLAIDIHADNMLQTKLQQLYKEYNIKDKKE